MGLFDKYRDWQYDKDVNKAKQFTEDTAVGFWELYHLALTWHGRYRLNKVIQMAQNEEIELHPQVISLYQFIIITAPYEEYAVLN